MAIDVSAGFVKMYEAEVHQAFQRKGSKLKPTVRCQGKVVGSSTTFQVAGKGTATSKARNAKVPAMNASRSTVECTLSDHYAGDWVDELDDQKTNADERLIVAETGARALGRKIDELILGALDTNSAHSIDFTSGLDKDGVLDAMQALGEADAFEEGEMFAVVGWQQWSQLLAIEEFADSDFIGDKELPWLTGFTAKKWLGTIWMPHSGLTLDAGVRYCHWYNKKAVGAAFGKDVTADVTWHGDYAAFFVNHFMSMGACLIDPTGTIRLDVTES